MTDNPDSKSASPGAVAVRPAVQPPTTEKGRIRPAPVRTGSKRYDAILELSVEHPLLGYRDVAILLGHPINHVQAIMNSAAFLEQRAALILERYGHQITGIRGQILTAASDAIEAIRQRIANPNSDVNPDTLLKATEFLMKFVAKPEADAAPGALPQNQTNVNITLTDTELQEARRIRDNHIRTITLTPSGPTGNAQKGD